MDIKRTKPVVLYNHPEPRDHSPSDYRPSRLVTRVATLPLFAEDPDIGQGYKLTRTYSETETNNFDVDTGHRLYDDGRIRTKPSRTVSPSRPPYRESSSSKLYLRSHDEYIDGDYSALTGLEDEYVPGLDFGDVLTHWTHNSSDASTPVSRDGLFLDLNKLHAKVAPQPIQFRTHPFSKGADFSPKPNSDTHHLKKKPKCSPTVVDPVSGEVNFNAVLASLPLNFSDLPYSQRKKMVKLFSESIDYSQFANFAKSYMGEKSSVGLGRKSESNSVVRNGSFLRKSRRNSANTIAGRLLALSLSSDLRKLDRAPKVNVDEKGAIVLGHELGRIIGFGAWGTIRECTNKDGVVHAIKIVKSTKDNEHSGKVHNPKVLQVFRKEIEIWQQLHHPSILPLLDHVATEDTIFCLTDRIGGGTLFEVVSRWGDFNEGVDSTGPFTFLVENQRTRLQTTIQFTRQIVGALHYMHQELGIVHGDLKLENVLVDDLDPTNLQVILCDFGMSRVYAPQISRKLSRLLDLSTDMGRSRSSAVPIRKPYDSPDTHNTRYLFADDLKVGILHLLRPHGPALQSVDLSHHGSHASLLDFHEFKSKDSKLGGEIDSDLPHLHIGLLPYASPELLNPLPPPLGPSADIWALGVLVYTMIVGRLPFQHPYEPRLRAIISAGKYSRRTLKQACLMEWLFEEEPSLSSSLVDMGRREQIERVKIEWEKHDPKEFEGVKCVIEGCLERDITKRWDIDLIVRELSSNHGVTSIAATDI
ncbi:CIC11C00000004147 [Sungouiella intermedia]|uniref:CIC11C00000004147 n=1 Tax=Sungouiella intermedia TaxID=45354 RepID=A0A1L0BI74_9ASCO|nr:CIC11C00000004147 [[Candida] intermedia]